VRTYSIVYRKIFLISFFLLGYSHIYAQELWTGFTLRLKPSSRLNAEIEQQFRFGNGINSLNTTFTEIGIGYDITKRLEVNIAYRNTIKTGDERVDNDKQRLSANASYNFGSNDTKFVLTYRLRYQTAWEKSNQENRDDYIRNRLNLDYNLTKRVQPYVGTEVFYKLNQNKEIRAFWLTLGLKTRIGKKIGLNTFYRIEKEQNIKYPRTNYIVGIMMVYRIKLYNKKSTQEDDTDMYNNQN
jgi:hypothetical protein